MNRGRGLVCTIAASCILASATIASAQFVVTVAHTPGDLAQMACAQRLKDTGSTARIPGLQVHLVAPDRPQYGHLNLTLRDSDGSSSTIDQLLGLAFLFHSAAHFHAFTTSDLYRRIKSLDHGAKLPRYWLAIAYGGFYQLFSRSAAITEPKHLFQQWILSPLWVRLPYPEFKALPSPLVLEGAYLGEAAMLKKAVEWMGADIKTVAAIEAPILKSISDRLVTAARFVNLTYSLVRPVIFVVDEEWGTIPRHLRQRLSLWIERSAQACSASNFATEQQLLNQLPNEGLKIVPTNRAAFMEPAWRRHMTELSERTTWTISDLDHIVLMGAKPRRLPTALIKTLSPKHRKFALARQKAIEASRRLVLTNVGVDDIRDEILTIWRLGLDDFAEEFRRKAATSPNRDGLLSLAQQVEAIDSPRRLWALMMKTDTDPMPALRLDAARLLERMGEMMARLPESPSVSRGWPSSWAWNASRADQLRYAADLWHRSGNPQECRRLAILITESNIRRFVECQ